MDRDSEQLLSGWHIGMKKRSIIVIFVLLLIAGYVTFSVFPVLSSLMPNVGLPFGYYGQFNRVHHRLRQIDALEIVDYHQHKDIMLEDFWFVLQTENGLRFDLQFSHVARTLPLFDQAEGLAVQGQSGQWLLYSQVD